MMGKYGNVEAIISIEGKTWGLYRQGGGINGEYPCMRDIATGAIPKGIQKSLIKSFLLANGIEPLKKWNTYELIRKTIEFKLYDRAHEDTKNEL